MNIRQLTKTDLPIILVIEQTGQDIPWSEEAFARCWEANYPGWVIEDEGEIIGFIWISLASGECHVLNLCISQVKQRKGYGRELLIYALNWSRSQGAGIVYLEVRRSNTRAIALYRKMNFKQIGERKSYYPTATGKEDALIFARDLGIEDIMT